jgi:hypothetical protein
MDHSLKMLVLIIYLSMTSIDKAICFHYLADMNAENDTTDESNVGEQPTQGKKSKRQIE